MNFFKGYSIALILSLISWYLIIYGIEFSKAFLKNELHNNNNKIFSKTLLRSCSSDLVNC